MVKHNLDLATMMICHNRKLYFIGKIIGSIRFYHRNLEDCQHEESVCCCYTVVARSANPWYFHKNPYGFHVIALAWNWLTKKIKRTMREALRPES